LATTAVTAGTYKSVTADAYGRITAGTNPTTISGFGITDAYTKTEVDNSLSAKLSTTGGTMSGAIAMGTSKITGMGDPTNAQDATTKTYVDGILGSATSAATSAAAAATSASNASTSASNASTSAGNASTSATNAAASATDAANTYDAFDDRYLGSKSTAPSVDNDGNALLTGALYWNTSTSNLFVWTGSTWTNAAFTAGGFATLTGVETLTNKTLTSPVINTPTGIVKGDVGLGSVDNTSDATKNSATATLTNKTLTTPIISSISNTGTLTLPTSTDTLVGRATTDTLTNKTLTNPTVTNYVETPFTANSSTAITIDLTNGTVQIITLTGNATITMPTATSGKSFIMFLKQDGTGSRTVTWSTVKWAGGTNPTITATASRQDIYSFFADGTNWYGVNVGQNYTP
jgi:hypothetical protein